MALVVVGGHTRNIGKTSLVAGLIAAMPEYRWTAIKITQFGHGVCSANGEPCDCETADHTIAISEEHARGSGTDTSRYLDAGANRSYWVRTRQGQLHEAMPRVRKLLAASEHSIVESNSILRFVQPTLSLTVLDPRVTDFKASASRYLDRVDAVLMPYEAQDIAGDTVAPAVLKKARRFLFSEPVYVSSELVSFVRAHLLGPSTPSE